MPSQALRNPKSDFHVEIVEDKELLQEIYRLRYEIYIEECGKKSASADPETRSIRDELDDSSSIFAVFSKNELVGSLRASFDTKHFRLPEFYASFFQLEKFREQFTGSIGVTSRLVIRKSWRSSPALGQLLSATYRFYQQNGMRIDFCHCQPGLLQLYEQLGYRRFRDNVVDEVMGLQVPLLLLLDDVDFLKNIRSPFLPLALKGPRSDESSKWFAEHFPEHAHPAAQRLVGTADFWSFLAEKLHENPEEGIPIFKGLNPEDSRKFLKICPVLEMKAGENILRQGDEGGNAMYLLLSGAVEIIVKRGSRSYSISTLGPGQSFGEIGLLSRKPRSADVRALTNVEMMVVNQRLFEKAMKNLPEIACRVLWNLAQQLGDRLRMSTYDWVENIDQQPQETS
jgi:predicted GNAT family N-acyltransferase